jgi:hypothetical protein
VCGCAQYRAVREFVVDLARMAVNITALIFE